MLPIPIRVLLVDDHTLVRESLVGILQSDGDIEVVAQAADGVEAIEKALATQPDIVITDLLRQRGHAAPGAASLLLRMACAESALPETRVLACRFDARPCHSWPCAASARPRARRRRRRAGASARAGAAPAAAARSRHARGAARAAANRGGRRGNARRAHGRGAAAQAMRMPDREAAAAPARVLDDRHALLSAREREVFRLIAEGLTTKEIAFQLTISSKTRGAPDRPRAAC
ncbi:MAG: hypothetical protein WDW38_006491 [Sanguina aurantia]